MADTAPLVSYKGFDKDWKCRGFQFAVGNEYTHKGDVKACESGFHACEYPLDVFGYYPPSTSIFAQVEQSGDLSKQSDDSKVASRQIRIVAQLSIAGLIKAAVDYTFSKALPVEPESPASATGTRGAASATGTRGAASATGDYSAASATGTRGAASATGYQGAASATGTRGAASATGTRGAASATGYQGAASATGTRGAASATGDYSAASATGTRGAASATGYQGAASATGEKSVAMASGYEGTAMAAEGCAIFLVYRDADYNIVHARASKVGQNGIEPGKFYKLTPTGEFQEVTNG